MFSTVPPLLFSSFCPAYFWGFFSPAGRGALMGWVSGLKVSDLWPELSSARMLVVESSFYPRSLQEYRKYLWIKGSYLISGSLQPSFSFWDGCFFSVAFLVFHACH